MHCKKLEPEYKKAAKQVKVPLAKVDATLEPELAKRFDVQGYPAVKFWKDGKDPINYDGERDSDCMFKNFISYNFEPIFSNCDMVEGENRSKLQTSSRRSHCFDH